MEKTQLKHLPYFTLYYTLLPATIHRKYTYLTHDTHPPKKKRINNNINKLNKRNFDEAIHNVRRTATVFCTTCARLRDICNLETYKKEKKNK